MAKSSNNRQRRGSGGTGKLAVRFTSGVRQLSPAQRETIKRRLNENWACVEHPSFSRPDGEVCLDKAHVSAGLESETSVSSALAGDMAPFSHLLSKEEERDLFLRMNYARYRLRAEADEARKKRVPIAKARQILEWDRLESTTRKRLVESNMPLVLSMAKKMRIQGVDFGDVVCEGNMALLRAVDGFDCSRGFKFSTYACRAILKSFARLAGKNNKYRMRFPTEFDPCLEKSDWLDTQRQEAAEYCTEELVKILQTNSAYLSDVELAVIKGRFAFGKDNKRETLVQMGEMLGLTKERVRQIQKKAVRRLREALEAKLTGG
ncbi:MAG: sigma-70 family RNA polymerase sigma factor [Phycisphaerae bacterium]|nr:sigma-70 family RNA polymerase sigma factor [Phycisphaerae bacterium]